MGVGELECLEVVGVEAGASDGEAKVPDVALSSTGAALTVAARAKMAAKVEEKYMMNSSMRYWMVWKGFVKSFFKLGCPSLYTSEHSVDYAAREKHLSSCWWIQGEKRHVTEDLRHNQRGDGNRPTITVLWT